MIHWGLDSGKFLRLFLVTVIEMKCGLHNYQLQCRKYTHQGSIQPLLNAVPLGVGARGRSTRRGGAPSPSAARRRRRRGAALAAL